MRKPCSMATLHSSWKSLRHRREGNYLPRSCKPSPNKRRGQDSKQGPRSGQCFCVKMPSCHREDMEGSRTNDDRLDSIVQWFAFS